MCSKIRAFSQKRAAVVPEHCARCFWPSQNLVKTWSGGLSTAEARGQAAPLKAQPRDQALLHAEAWWLGEEWSQVAKQQEGAQQFSLTAPAALPAGSMSGFVWHQQCPQIPVTKDRVFIESQNGLSCKGLLKPSQSQSPAMDRAAAQQLRLPRGPHPTCP